VTVAIRWLRNGLRFRRGRDGTAAAHRGHPRPLLARRVPSHTERIELFDVGGRLRLNFAPGETTVVDPETRIFRYAGCNDKATATSGVR